MRGKTLHAVALERRRSGAWIQSPFSGNHVNCVLCFGSKECLQELGSALFLFGSEGMFPRTVLVLCSMFVFVFQRHVPENYVVLCRMYSSDGTFSQAVF